MSKVGRNDPCPCGSGKKYKKCCLGAAGPGPAGSQGSILGLGANGLDFSELDNLSNSVVDLINAGDLDRAEEACRRLQKEYPEQVDGVMRRGMVEEARGNRAVAAKYYREAAEFMRSEGGFDEGSIADLIQSAERMEAER